MAPPSWLVRLLAAGLGISGSNSGLTWPGWPRLQGEGSGGVLDLRPTGLGKASELDCRTRSGAVEVTHDRPLVVHQSESPPLGARAMPP